jgi:hypothetical protein
MHITLHEAHLFHDVESGFNSFAIELPVMSLTDWCLHMNLLLFRAVDTLKIGPALDGSVLVLHHNQNEIVNSGRGTYFSNDKIVDISLPREQIELLIWLALQHLYTQYIRIKTGYTDHIDIEIDSSTDDKLIDLAVFIV